MRSPAPAHVCDCSTDDNSHQVVSWRTFSGTAASTVNPVRLVAMRSELPVALAPSPRCCSSSSWIASPTVWSMAFRATASRMRKCSCVWMSCSGLYHVVLSSSRAYDIPANNSPASQAKITKAFGMLCAFRASPLSGTK